MFIHEYLDISIPIVLRIGSGLFTNLNRIQFDFHIKMSIRKNNRETEITTNDQRVWPRLGLGRGWGEVGWVGV